MVSSGGGGDNGLAAMLMSQAATPMPGLPVAGKDSPTIDPATYGKYQSFLPDPKSSGPNDVATGLRPEMLEYKPPHGTVDPEISKLRDQLAQLQAKPAAGPAADANGYTPKYLPNGQLDPNDPGNIQQFYRLTSGGGGAGGPAQPVDSWTNRS
jgi:hypothetical protein